MDSEPLFADGLLTPENANVSIHKPLNKRKKQHSVQTSADKLAIKRNPSGKRKRRKTTAQSTLSKLLETAASSPTAAETLCTLSLFPVQPKTEKWRGYAAVPAGSLLEEVCKAFADGTSIPLEIPFAATFSLIAGFLCKRGIYLMKGEDRLDPVYLADPLG